MKYDARSQLSANTVESVEVGAECATPLNFILAANCELVCDV